ncbi:polyhydroxyalkanoate synthesis regulator DNA-binding domain-containing protein [Balneolales bacterium ANBcel1]|nr:polyhydroxyalkanoate synthesis regulator DNA-binding domain-containing protein [Balneolales bacterium ANBcel1]
MSERIIKRYANRKMYDVAESRYVSLSDLAEMIRAGETIRVTNKTGDEDYTSRILQQIILEQTKESDKATVGTLHEWIRVGGSFLDEQLMEFRSGMEDWLKKQSSRLFPGLNRKEFDHLKKKVDELEKKLDQMS